MSHDGKTQLQIYSQMLFEPDDIMELRLIRKRDEKIVKRWVKAGELPEKAEMLEKHNQNGFDIYAGVNPRKDFELSSDININIARCLFVDFDHIASDGISWSEVIEMQLEDAGLPQPTMTIMSGHGIHCYWLLDKPLTDMTLFRLCQERLIATLHSDNSIKNPERIMRLPGFLNVKYPAEPVPVTVIDADKDRRYLLAEITNHLVEVTLETAPTPDAISDDELAAGFGGQEATALIEEIWASKSTSSLSPIDRATLYAAKWPGVAEGGRNPEAYKLACCLVKGFNLSETDACPILLKWNDKNIPKLEIEELRKTLRSATKYAKGSAGEKLEASKPDPAKSDDSQTAKRTKDKTASELSLTVKTMNTIVPKRIEYVVPEILARGFLTTLISQEGVGKSTLVSKFIAKITNGTPWLHAPGHPHIRGDVILFSDEEDPACVLAPRLIANEANMSRVHLAGCIASSKGKEFGFDVQRYIEYLDALLKQFANVQLVVFDPITSYVHCNENSNSEVRTALKPLIDFAAARNVAVLGLSHFNKKIDAGMINRTIGSRAWSAVPRVIWGVRTFEKDDEEGNKTDTGERALLCIKCNLGRKPQGLAFTIGEGGAVTLHGDRINASMDDAGNQKRDNQFKVDEAGDWLLEYLGDEEIESDKIFEAAEAAGFKKQHLYKAKKAIKSIKARKRGFHNGWSWRIYHDT